MRLGDLRHAVEAVPTADPLHLIGAGGLVVLAPHPDDETIGASALIAATADAGRKLVLVALTNGEGSHRGSTAFPPRRLADLRRSEQDAAMAILCAGASFETLRLDLPDGASQWHPEFGACAMRIAALCDRIGATALAATLPDDPHPDHHAAGRLAHAVRTLRPHLRLLFYPVWLARLDDTAEIEGDDLTPFRLPVPMFRKSEALACHASQLGQIVEDDADGFVLPEWFLARQAEPLEAIFWAAMPGHPPGAAHFASLYADDGDPWHVRSSASEAEKRQATLAVLGDRRFENGLEIGCAEGHLTTHLAERCQHMLGIDLDPAIIRRAIERHGGNRRLAFRQGRLPEAFPKGRFDLLVFSEVLYYLREAELRRLAGAVEAATQPGAHLLLVDYLGTTDTPLPGADAADVFMACLGTGWRADTSSKSLFRIDHLQRIEADREVR